MKEVRGCVPCWEEGTFSQEKDGKRNYFWTFGLLSQGKEKDREVGNGGATSEGGGNKA